MTLEDSRSDQGPTQSVQARDVRVDRAVSWVLGAVATVALTVGAGFFSSLRGELAKLGDAVSSLKTQVALQGERDKALDRLRERVDRIAEVQQDERIRAKTLDARVARLELQTGARTPR